MTDDETTRRAAAKLLRFLPEPGDYVQVFEQVSRDWAGRDAGDVLAPHVVGLCVGHRWDDGWSTWHVLVLGDGGVDSVPATRTHRFKVLCPSGARRGARV